MGATLLDCVAEAIRGGCGDLTVLLLIAVAVLALIQYHAIEARRGAAERPQIGVGTAADWLISRERYEETGLAILQRRYALGDPTLEAYEAAVARLLAASPPDSQLPRG